MGWGRAYKTAVQPLQVVQNRRDPDCFLMCFVAKYVFTYFYLLQSFAWLQHKNM